jgi:N-acetyltransferase 10
LDDELNVLPISKAKDITPIEERGKGKVGSEFRTSRIVWQTQNL